MLQRNISLRNPERPFGTVIKRFTVFEHTIWSNQDQEIRRRDTTYRFEAVVFLDLVDKDKPDLLSDLL
jgi:hypothetical protein